MFKVGFKIVFEKLCHTSALELDCLQHYQTSLCHTSALEQDCLQHYQTSSGTITDKWDVKHHFVHHRQHFQI